ncbi:MAG: ThuA domain-containing protein [Verrucomicrobiota bacterium]
MKLSRFLMGLLSVACALVAAAPMIAAEAPKKVLVVSVTMGFRHASIPTGEKILSEMAAKSGKFTVEFVRQPEGLPKAPTKPKAPQKGKADPDFDAALKKFEVEEKAYWTAVEPQFRAALEKLSPANLKNYDAVLFLSTTGDLPLPDPKGFVDWVASGKGFVGVHAAADTFHKTGRFAGFPPYTAMIGAAFRTHGPQVTVDCIKKDDTHAACAPLPATWTVFDEIYEFKDYEQSRVHSLISLEKLPQSKEPGHNGIAWSKMHGKGRVFYTSLGHREDVWDPSFKEKDGSRKNSPEVAQQYQAHLSGGILWALGLAPGGAKTEK